MEVFFQKIKMYYSQHFGFARSIFLTATFLIIFPFLSADAFELFDSASKFVAGYAMQTVNEIMKLLVGAAVYFFGLAAGLLVTSFQFSLLPFNNIQAIVLAWTIMRDIANVFFIFILLVIAIATILRLESYGIKRLLPTLIIVALFINFSLLATQYIIFPANWLSEDILTSIGLTVAGGDLTKAVGGLFQLNTATILSSAPSSSSYRPGVLVSAGAGCAIGAIAGLGVASTLGCPLGAVAGVLSHFLTAMIFSSTDLDKEVPIFTYYAGMLAIVVVATFSLLAAAIMVIARSVILMMLMVVSPLAFLAHAVPGAQGYARKWWSALFTQAWFLPIYALFIYVAIALSNAAKAALGTIDTSKSILENPQVILFSIMSVIILIAGLVFAKQMGAYGAGLAIRYGQRGYRMAGGYAGRLSKRTFVGRPARRIKESRIAQSIASQFPRTLGKAYQLAEKGAKAGGLGKSEEAQMALLQSLGAEHRPRTFANLSQRAQDQALEKMSARDIAEMKERSRGTAHDATIERATGRLSVEKREKVEEETAKVMARNATSISDLADRFRALNLGAQQAMVREEKELTKAINRLAPTVADLATGFATLPDDMQQAYLQGASKDEIQGLAKEYERRGGTQGADFVNLVNTRASKRNNEVFAVLPGHANNPGFGASAVPYRDMVSRMDMTKTSAAHISGNAALMTAIVQHSGMKQIREIFDRNDAITTEYNNQMQAMWTAAGKNAAAMAAQLRALGNDALAGLVEHNDEARKFIGLT